MKRLIVACLAVSCGIAFGQESTAAQEKSDQEKSSPEKNPGFAERSPRYRLAPSDVISIHYRYSPEFDQEVSIQPDGFVSLQLVGDIQLAGLTLDQARDKMIQAASKRLEDPEITITLSDYQKPFITVAGEVAKPGRIELRGRVTAVEAIAMAGGFREDRAKHSQVILFRRINPDMAETKVLNVKQILHGPNFKEDITLVPGDLLVVPQNTVSKVERFIHWANVGMFMNPTP